ncbi:MULTISPECIES: Na(+)/H(+) antiporter subunit B [unclassified Bacillus (in: firmicutes)]|jgi:multicomponent Na+:H+ antiporter subunit B|uniref:Na(+)/H(+) antiporter subunit B n=1 Tax=unclassified Bacillus (in: firmicutes) TaxID=185979 RepID=UPI0004E1D8FC|nr:MULTISPECIES: Na(+)/H(+) antiporter subunit B [unclassified Bacillus (in: firmicutes)]CAI9392597.1 Na(+)/H(+) antiporter subunit B [Bacillus sp. T2.9-1]
MKINNLVLQTITKVIVFLILLYSVDLFFAGHYTPGGGFIGGLMASGAIVLLLITYDIKFVKKIFPINFIYVTAIGLLISTLTGMIAVLFNKPFLTHFFNKHAHLPLLGETSLHTAALFDLGVFLVVVGVTMTIIQTIGEDD